MNTLHPAEELNEQRLLIVRAIQYCCTFQDMESVTHDYIEKWTNLKRLTVVRVLRNLIDSKHVLCVEDEEDEETQTFRLTKMGRLWVQSV